MEIQQLLLLFAQCVQDMTQHVEMWDCPAECGTVRNYAKVRIGVMTIFPTLNLFYIKVCILIEYCIQNQVMIVMFGINGKN